MKRLPLPKRGPHIAEIELRTPYEQVVLRARNAPDGYSSQQAAQDYRAQAGRILVRVLIYLTPTYPAHTPIVLPFERVELRPEDFWRDFEIRLSQESEIAATRVSGKPIYSVPAVGGLPGLVGAEVEVEFDAANVTSAPVRVEVLTPDRKKFTAEFDLEKLR